MYMFFVILSSSDCHVTFNPLYVTNLIQKHVFFHALSTKIISVTTIFLKNKLEC